MKVLESVKVTIIFLVHLIFLFSFLVPQQQVLLGSLKREEEYNIVFAILSIKAL